MYSADQKTPRILMQDLHLLRKLWDEHVVCPKGKEYVLVLTANHEWVLLVRKIRPVL